MHSIDWIIIAVFFAILLAIPVLTVRKGSSSTKEFFLSGRSMPWWLIGVSVMAASTSTDSANLFTEIIRKDGMSGNWAWWAFMLTGLLTVFVYAKLWYRSGVTTDVEFYELRYSGKPAAFLRALRAVYLGFVFNLLIMGAVILGGVKIGVILFGVSPAFFPSLMTIHVFVMMFFLTFYVHGEHSAPKIVTATVLCALYVAGLTAPDTDAWRFLTMGAASLMGLLSVYGVASHQELGKLPVDREGYRNVSREVFSEMVFAAALSVPALALSRNAFLFLANGALSSFMSFGGGDAYLTVADGLFVGAGLLDSDTFYGRIAPVVNLFPGSILCKTLSAVGYSVGMAETDSVAVAFSLAIGGFACSVSGSCLSFSAMKYIYQRFGTLPVFALIRNGVRPVVSGLMLSVIVTMLRQGGKVETDAFFLNGVSLLLAEWALGCFLKFRRKWNGAKIIACLTLCNAPIL